MDFAAELAERVAKGIALDAAIAQAAIASGLGREPTLKDVQAARARFPQAFPLTYPRLTRNGR